MIEVGKGIKREFETGNHFVEVNDMVKRERDEVAQAEAANHLREVTKMSEVDKAAKRELVTDNHFRDVRKMVIGVKQVKWPKL